MTDTTKDKDDTGAKPMRVTLKRTSSGEIKGTHGQTVKVVRKKRAVVVDPEVIAAKKAEEEAERKREEALLAQAQAEAAAARAEKEAKRQAKQDAKVEAAKAEDPEPSDTPDKAAVGKHRA